MIEITTKLGPRESIDKIVENLMNEYISFNVKFFSDYIAIETDILSIQFRRFDGENHLCVKGNEKDLTIYDFNKLYKIIRGV